MSGERSNNRTERERQALMPRSAPSPHGLAPLPYARSRAERAALAERHRDERAIATLAGQLRALEHDIDAARGTASRSPLGLGWLLNGHPHPPHARRDGERVRLADGAEILIRPIEPQDAAELRAGFERLGAVSRYRRFLTEIDRLSPEQLGFLTHVDHQDHEALAALTAETGTGIGTARYVRDATDRAQAEVAVVVADDWQRRGVGAALLERLAQRARQSGIERFTARMIVGNEPAHRLLRRVGDVIAERQGAATTELTLQLR